MKIYEYKTYDAYVEAQTAANKRKINQVWVHESTVQLIAKYIRYKVRRILCHGTRNGAEQLLFKASYPKAWVIGTEISETATTFPHTIQHDFHEPYMDFAERFDVVYSNSFDHAYDPLKALCTWRDQLGLQRRLFLEVGLGKDVNYSKQSDPLQIDDGEIRKLIADANLRLIRTFSTIGGGNHRSTLYVAERSQ